MPKPQFIHNATIAFFCDDDKPTICIYPKNLEDNDKIIGFIILSEINGFELKCFKGNVEYNLTANHYPKPTLEANTIKATITQHKKDNELSTSLGVVN